jgi:hypothetical protein
MHAAAHRQDPSPATEASPALKKRNFIRFPVAIDRRRLLADYESIPPDAWGVSYWDVHCSIDVLLLRGGDKGDAGDFCAQEIKNNPILEKLPYIASLIEPDGPFGGAVYAFIFKTKPNGITRAHRDRKEEWHRALRIHMPIVTNPGAFLLAEGRAKHLEVGEAWSFDNQSLHAVVNGPETRVHLIIDVNPNPKLFDLMHRATIDPGRPDPERWEKVAAHLAPRAGQLKVADDRPLTPAEKQEQGMAVDGFATRIVRTNLIGRAFGAPLKSGDIVFAVNGVESNAQSRSVLDHIRMNHAPGETVTLAIVRKGRRIEKRMRLWPDYCHPKRLLDKVVHPGRAAGGNY